MSTAEEGGAAANATTSSYGGGGAGGKFPKRPSRRQATPYERPSAALRVNNANSSNSSSSWLTKLVVEPASKLITYGADRFFGSVFRRNLPPPPLPHPPESNAQESDMDQGTGLNSRGGGQEPESGQCSQPINSSSNNAVAELENLLKQKTFSRSEIAHLAELLQSRAAEVSPGDASQINVVPAVDSGRQNQFESRTSEGNRNDGNKSSPVMFTPIQSSHVLENDMASPAELAKAYMGRRPSQVSPSALGMRNQLGKESIGFAADTLVASKSPLTSLATRTSVSRGAADNGFITPRPRGRSAMYTMARTPYSRVHPTSTLKGSGINRSVYAGPSTSSSNFSPLDNDRNLDSQPGNSKRRSSVLDDEIGSVGPMRRTRQKPNLLASRFSHAAHGVGVGSHAKQKPQLNGEERNKVLKNSGENENESVPSTSYAHVPNQSKEVAAKILQQLERISPKEKSSESKLGAMQEKSPLKQMPSRLSGQGSQRMQDAGSSKLLLNFQDDLKTGNKTNVALPDVHESSPQNLEKAEGDNPIVSLIPSSRWNSVLNNDSAVSLKASNTGLGAADFVVKNAASQPQKKRAFRMNADEDAVELDGVECNGLASRSFSEHKGPFESLLTKPAGESKNALQFGSSSGAVTFGQGTSFFAVPASEGTRAASQSQTFASFGEQNETNSLHVFSSSSKAADKFPLLPSDSIKRAESQPQISSSLANVSTPVDAAVAVPETEPVKAVDTNGKCDDVSSATLNGHPVSISSPVSLPAISPSDNHRISTNSVPPSTSSPSITNLFSTSSAATTGGSLSGWAAKSSSLSGPFPKFGSSVELPNTVSAVPAANYLERADQGAKIDMNPSSGSSASSHSNFFAAATSSSGNGIFKFGSSSGNSTGSSPQSSIIAGATKSPMFGANTITEGKPVEPVSSASAPALNSNTGASFGSLPTPSIPSFGLSSSSTSSSDTTSLISAGGPTSSLFKFGASPTAVSEGSAVSSSTSTAPISFGLSSSSSSSTNPVFSSSGPAMPVFTSGGSSISAFEGGTSGLFGSGGSSSASVTTNLVSSSSAPTSNIFGSGFQSPKFPTFSSSFASASPSSGFSFSASTNATAAIPFNSSTGASSSPLFSFTAASASAVSSQPSPFPQSVFGNPPTSGGFAASPGNNDQMNAEDTMAEDPAPSSAPTTVPPGFGQPSPSPSPFTFGSNAPTQSNPFMSNGQQSQSPLQNPSPFAASSSLEFNSGGGFSVGSTGVDKSGRKIVKINRSKNRKK